MEHQHSDYNHYTTTSFFKDEQFIQHVLKADDLSTAYWERISGEYPDKRAAMEEARAWILLINKQKPYQPATGKLQLWDKITNQIAADEQRQQRVYRPLKIASRWIGAAAAALILLVALREWSSLGEKKFSTTFGKREQVVLPDETVVTLNGNSAIHYARTWKSEKPREIWMQGEAFFEVKHVALKNRLQQSDSFLVHVSNLELKVLGTKFNVRNRRSITEISLLEGSLRIEKNGTGAFVQMLKPGDAFMYDSSKQVLTAMNRKPQANKAWTNNEMDLDGYTLSEILNVLEDTYGYEISLQAPELAQKKLSGTVPAANADDILFVIRKVFNLKIDQKANHLIISQN
ncbi:MULTISPECIES: FecR family protein [unclassified Chitinophaga]|uniref:FecR family protein n=1 Tax=unclassified Chitinophaga TaxID=2619133 RepID=UPI00300FA49B